MVERRVVMQAGSWKCIRPGTIVGVFKKNREEPEIVQDCPAENLAAEPNALAEPMLVTVTK